MLGGAVVLVIVQGNIGAFDLPGIVARLTTGKGALIQADHLIAKLLQVFGAPLDARFIEYKSGIIEPCIAGLGIDNLYIDITAEEVPILDGSAASFVFLLQSAGIALQDAPKRFLRVKEPVEVRQGEGKRLMWARLEPYHGFKLSFEIDFGHPAVDATGQRVTFDMGSGRYKRDIARARTFGFTKDVEAMRSRGLTLGGSMDNAIVVDDSRVLNADGLRYDDEFAKHKILDAIGDLYNAGHPMLAHYTAYKSGHALNNLLLRELESRPEAWEIVTFDNERQAPTGFAQPVRAW